MRTLVPYIWMAGLVQLLMAASNALLPRRLQYRENLAKVSPIIRQIFIVHSVYIVFILIIFSGLCLFFASELAGASPLGTFLSGCMALFWLPRIFIQRFYYDAEVKKQNRPADAAFTLALSFLAATFVIAALRVME